MKYLLIIFCFSCQFVLAQKIQFANAVFKTGDNAAWANEQFEDKDWAPIQLQTYWEKQGYDKYDGFAWYRIHFNLPSSLKEKAILKTQIEIYFPGIDDADITYLNGNEIGKTGRMPEDPNGYKSGGRIKERHYLISADNPVLHWDKDNVIAIRVYDGGGTGGVFGDQHYIRFLDPIDYITMDTYSSIFEIHNKKVSKDIYFQNKYSGILKGILTTTVKWGDSLISKNNQSVQLLSGKSQITIKNLPLVELATVSFVFTEELEKKSQSAVHEIPYILTPIEKDIPRIHSSAIFGSKPGVPFLLAIAATGIRPMQFQVTGLPKGLSFDSKAGLIKGNTGVGTYSIKVSAKNKIGKDEKTIELQIGDDKVMLTPPMGWNSWNCWGLSVSDQKVRSSADAMIRSGLTNHGWNYINIDDGWEASGRLNNGNITPNEKFPDMKALGDYLHAQGQKFGIYSSPGSTTCGGFLGSYQKESEDAITYGLWGVDYLKYDLCSYRKLYPNGLTLDQLQEPYLVMYHALKSSGRNIVYSLCEYGMQDVWKWGKSVGGNVWRTTGDITDNWNSLKNIGFSQEVPASFNSPDYGFGDPDMLIVGFVGWGDNLHLTKLTPSEQYTHMSLWCLLNAPLMLGCDLTRIDPFTYNLLSNDEVLAIDQDILARGPKKYEISDNLQIWVKELADGSKALGIFNMSNARVSKMVELKEVGLLDKYKITDLWRQKYLISGNTIKVDIPAHGVTLLKIFSS